MVVPHMHSLVEQVHLDVDRCFWSFCIDSTACTLVPRRICFDLALGARCPNDLAATDPRGLVGLREVHECVDVKGHFQDGIGNDFWCLIHVALDGHVARQAVSIGEGHRFDSDGVIVLDVRDILSMALVFTP